MIIRSSVIISSISIVVMIGRRSEGEPPKLAVRNRRSLSLSIYIYIHIDVSIA